MASVDLLQKGISDEDAPDDIYTACDTVQGHEKSQLKNLLEDLGLKDHYYTKKISLSKVLQIDEKTISDAPARCQSDPPWYFLKKLMMVNVKARNVKMECESECDSSPEDAECEFDHLLDITNSDAMVNPLDIVTALFLCSDGFLQQEMALKMSICQFAVPLLLPNCDTHKCTLMLWALRDIVKKYRPESVSQSKGFVEARIVCSELPMISFVRLGECSLSKSKILNMILSNSQQYHDTFVHHDMQCGERPRRISNGLTEITWYLPCGNVNIDIFREPVAVANLRGDIASFETQFAFLCHTSAAVFVFFDKIDPKYKLLSNKKHNAQIFLVGNHQSESFSIDDLKKVATVLNLGTKNIIIKTKHKNDADFVERLRKAVKNVIENTKMKMSIEQMAVISHELGILIDEDCRECQTARKNAEAITAQILDTFKYKENQLPLQGNIWKKLTKLEKEKCRLKDLGSGNIETYMSGLEEKQRQLRKEQNSHKTSVTMSCFIEAISSPGTERRYFLKWMQMNLDNQSREKLSHLRKQYKEKCKDSKNKDAIKVIDRELSNSSLGIEHFFREMGQIYEASLFLPGTDPLREQSRDLPNICARLLLDGFPLELVDGDTSNIPLTWVRDVLSQLNTLVSPNNKILVVTVLGVQSTGKSTLLNTMFGVQFAVSSGRCTRGAFMLLIRIDEDVKKDLNCDFLVIIDTEGLKSPELAELDDSHEHDNELATVVVGLSDITIINIAMENSTQMKDILQIVVHAFLRMKEVGIKPKCQFVHQNVSDVSADENNLRQRKMFLEQLNEMTRAAAKMERKEENNCFTDVMDYNAETGNWYIPGLWNGNPPMASVNAGYSEAVYQLKKNIIKLLGNRETAANDISKFNDWMSSLWDAVKHENFIFSFRNSLVADAYMNLCTEFTKWEWEIKEHMYKWGIYAETTISNFGTLASKSEEANLNELVLTLETEASTKLSELENELREKLKMYFEQKDGHVNLVQGYKEDFVNSAKNLRKNLESSVIRQLTAAKQIKEGMKEIDKIKQNHTDEIEKAVCELIDECREKRVHMSDKELDQEFDKMWEETIKNLASYELTQINVFTSVTRYLRQNLSPKGSHACELLRKRRLEDCGQDPFKCTAVGILKQAKHMGKKYLHLPIEDPVAVVQHLAGNIIDECTEYVNDKVNKEPENQTTNKQETKKLKDYSDVFIEEILQIIDQRLQTNLNHNTDIEFEVSLKQHICGFAARGFQKMHDDFRQENDPYICLNNHRGKFCKDFKDIFCKRDQSQKKAEEFTNQCLKPAVARFVYSELGPHIIREMKAQPQFLARVYAQNDILLDLLSKDNFADYLRYICSYEGYVKDWILKQTVQHFSKDSKAVEFEKQHLESSISSINDAIHKAKKKTSGDLKTFIKNFCQELGSTLVIPQDALGAFMILNKANQEQFAQWFTQSVKEMEETLRKEFRKTSFDMKLKHLDVKPQNELFSQIIGCGKQCPFCGVACVAGGASHSEHRATLHRPQGLYKWRKTESKKLVTDICTSSVISDKHFCCDTKNKKFHPYKKYTDYFSDWKIPPDGSFQASNYWKYVMNRFNDKFAEEYNAEPADIPFTWKSITPAQAEESVKESLKN